MCRGCTAVRRTTAFFGRVHVVERLVAVGGGGDLNTAVLAGGSGEGAGGARGGAARRGGADINAAGRTGRTPLGAAVARRHSVLPQTLLVVHKMLKVLRGAAADER